ncbi:MAG: SlyX family protein [Rhodobacteraceae bacterium]|nr:SlyX family protein [Paracoccaceae bacterium]
MTELETQLAHTTRQAEELSDVVADQAKRIELLERRVERLMERAASEEAAGTGGVVLGDQKPPHW